MSGNCYLHLSLIACGIVVAGVAPLAAQDSLRPPQWAQPVELEGVPNLHRVTDNLYRSAQPTAAGMQNLQTLGIETIINLRSFHSDRNEIGDTGLGYEHIYMKAWHPEDKELVRFLQLVTNPKRQPVLVHCMHGADRTGLMCAVYRIVVQNWSKDDAIREMVEGGYGFCPVWLNIKLFVYELDVEAIRQRARLPPVKLEQPTAGASSTQ